MVTPLWLADSDSLLWLVDDLEGKTWNNEAAQVGREAQRGLPGRQTDMPMPHAVPPRSCYRHHKCMGITDTSELRGGLSHNISQVGALIKSSAPFT